MGDRNGVNYGVLGVDIALDIAELGIHASGVDWDVRVIADVYNQGRAEELFGPGVVLDQNDILLAEKDWRRAEVDIPPEFAEIAWIAY